MAENNFSAPLKTAEGVDSRTPADMRVNGGALKLALNVLRRAGKNEVADELEKTAEPAVAAQAAPAAVAVPDEREVFENWVRSTYWALNLEKIDDGYRAPITVALWDSWQARAALAATPALPATEDSSAGDLAHDTLRCAVGNCTFNGEVAQHAAGCQQSTQPSHAEVQAEPVAFDLAYTNRVIEALQENGDPVSVDAAEEMAKLRDLLLAAPQAQPADALDAAFEAVRKRFCKLPRYSILLDSRGNVRRAQDPLGNWVEFEAAHALFDPVAVDAAMAAAQEGGNAAKEA